MTLEVDRDELCERELRDRGRVAAQLRLDHIAIVRKRG
jgi:hypothetical protein